MNYKSLLFPFLTAALVMPAMAGKRNVNEKPNIIFILADDLSYRDISIYGQQRFSTPNIDNLAKNGIRFSQAYSAAPECAPSRGALMTGMHCGKGTIKLNESIKGQNNLRDEDITVAEMLKTAGYKTAFTGKWGIGLPGTEGVPHKQGFDYAFGFYDQLRAHTFFPEYLYENGRKVEYPGNIGFSMNRQYRTVNVEVDPDDLNVYDADGKISPKEIRDRSKLVYSEKEIQDRALKFIEGNYESPFFLYFATPLPHGPIIVDNLGNLKDRTDFPDQRQKEWAAMVITIDDFVGRLVDKLKELGIYENTIIFFASDNGYSMHRYIRRDAKEDWSDDAYLQNKGPFPGGKFSAREGGMRIPFFISWEGKIKPAVYSEPVWLADFFITAAELSGQKLKNTTSGESLLPFINGEPEAFPGHRFMYWYRIHEQSVRYGAWHAYRKHPDADTELYLIEEDSYCERNLAPFYPQVVAEVEAIMEREHVWDKHYFNPGDDRAEFMERTKKAREEGLFVPSVKGNASSPN